MIENVRPGAGATLAPPRFDFHARRGAPSFGEFDQQHTVSGMGAVTLPGGEMGYPDGAVFLPATGAMHDPPLEPVRLAELKEQHARAWLADAVKTFDDCKRAAQQNPMGHDWPSDLRRLKDVADRAKQNLKACHEAFEIACGRGPEWRRQQKQMAQAIERDRQRQEQARSKALQAINEITLDADTPSDADDE